MMNSDIFQGFDLGVPEKNGSFAITEGGLDIAAGGTDIWEKGDEGFFVCVPRTGDFDLACRIESLTSANLYTKAGLMARETRARDSRYAYFLVFPENAARNKNNGGYEFSYRAETGEDCAAIYPPDAPNDPAKFPIAFPNAWLRLARAGDSFVASVSDDGLNWRRYSQFSLPLGASLLLGFAVTSHNAEATVAAKFRNITLG